MSNQKLANKAEHKLRSLASKIANHEGAMTAAQLAKILGVSKITIEKRARRGTIPRFYVGSLVRFDPSNVAKWLLDVGVQRMSGNKF